MFNIPLQQTEVFIFTMAVIKNVEVVNAMIAVLYGTVLVFFTRHLPVGGTCTLIAGGI